MSGYYDKWAGLRPTKKYDTGTALSLAIACDLAYENHDENGLIHTALIKELAAKWGYSFAETVNKQTAHDVDTQGFVMGNRSDVIAVFRGSDAQTVRDPGPFKGTKVHEGFQDALYPAVIKMSNLLDEARTRNQRIWITGHSLGGALASLYAAMLIENDYPVYGLYTFASPRPGDSHFAEVLGEKLEGGPHWRVVNQGDLVPHVPPEPFFSHPGQRKIIRQGRPLSLKRSWFKERVMALEYFVENVTDRFKVAQLHLLSAGDDSYIPRLLADYER